MIEFSHVSKLFGAQKAVNDLNLNFQEGSFSVLIGTSGSGKSTTLKMINRLVEHDSRGDPLCRRRNSLAASTGVAPPDGLCHSIYWPVPPLERGAKHRYRAAITKMVAARIDDRIDELWRYWGWSQICVSVIRISFPVVSSNVWEWRAHWLPIRKSY